MIINEYLIEFGVAPDIQYKLYISETVAYNVTNVSAYIYTLFILIITGLFRMLQDSRNDLQKLFRWVWTISGEMMHQSISEWD